MSRRILHIASNESPVASWTFRVESQHRLRLPVDLGLVVTWLPDCDNIFLFVGAIGGMRLLPEKSKMVGTKATLFRELATKPPSEDDFNAEWLPIARYQSTSWRVPLVKERTRFSITLPEDARKLGLCPSAGELAVVFGGGELLEVWPAQEWISAIRRTASIDAQDFALVPEER